VLIHGACDCTTLLLYCALVYAPNHSVAYRTHLVIPLLLVCSQLSRRGLAIPPWLGTVKILPSWFEKSPTYDPSAPPVKPTRQCVYGYRCHDTRSNIAISSEGRIIYHAAALVISIDGDRNQIFFEEHTDDILCLAQAQHDPNIIMTCQKASIAAKEVPGDPPTIIRGAKRPPFFSIRNVSTFERIAQCVELRIQDRFITACGFSCDGLHCAVAINSEKDENYVAVYNISTRKIVYQKSSARSQILGLAWSPTDPRTFVTVGKEYVSAWTFKATEGAIQETNIGSKVPAQTYNCVLFTSTGNQFLVGAADGGIYVYLASTLAPRKVFRVHEKAVNTICRYGKYFVSGGNDRRLCLLDNQLQPIWQVQFNFAVRAIASNPQGDLAVGTRGSELYFIPKEKQGPEGKCVPVANLDPPLTQSHYAGEIWGLATNPQKPSQFCTVGEDNQIIVWDAVTKSSISSALLNSEAGLTASKREASTSSDFPINHMARAVAYSPNGEHIAVGFNDGCISVFDSKSLKLITRKNVNQTNKSQQWIEDLKYSPNGKWLAVPTHGSSVRFLDVSAGYKIVAAYSNCDSALTALDWSADSTHVRTIALSGMVTFVNCEELPKAVRAQTSARFAAELNWASTTCKWSWDTMGVWAHEGRKIHDTSDINRVDACPSRGIVAAATDYGVVNVFRYPAPYSDNPKFIMNSHSLTGHSSHIPNVRFSSDGKYMFTVGGEDKTIIQWRV